MRIAGADSPAGDRRNPHSAIRNEGDSRQAAALLLFCLGAAMARNQTVLQILVASPSDVDLERDTIEEIVVELNNTLGAKLPVRLELIQ